MLGFGDFWVALAFILCIGITFFCVIYGYLHWNDDTEMPAQTHPEDENTDFDETV
jgi:hypothetical protein